MVQIKQIDYFLAVVRENSFTRAAKALYISQSSLSQYIRSLEEQIGLPLFSRSKNGPIKLTEAGELYYASAIQIETIRNALNLQIETLKKKSRSSITWGHAGKQGIHFLSLLLPLFHEMQFNVIQSSTAELEQMLLNGTIDLACSAVIKKNPALAYHMLRSDTLNIAVSSSHPLASFGADTSGDPTPAVSISEFSTSSFVLQDANTTTRLAINQLCKKADFTPSIELEVTSTFHALSVLSGGNYASFVPGGYTFPGVRFIRLKEQQPFSVYIYCRKDTESDQTISKIISVAKTFSPLH